jgi:hypothetical protein
MYTFTYIPWPQNVPIFFRSPSHSYIKQASYQNIHLSFPPDTNTYDSIMLWYAYYMDQVCTHTHIYYELYVIHNF